MSFTNYLEESSKYVENGNGSKQLDGTNLNLHVFSNVHNDNKRLSISIETVKNLKNNSSTWKGEKAEAKERAKAVQQKVIDALKADFDKLDEKITKLYDEHLGKDRTKE